MLMAIIAPDADASLIKIIAKALKYVELRAEHAERQVEELRAEIATLKQGQS
jgi:hypothetical protein